MRRRDLIKVIASTVSLWPFRARAIGRSLARIGFLPLGSPSNQYDMSYVEAFRGGLTDNGLIEGRNVTLDTVWVTNEPQYDQAVIELVRQGARVLVPAGSSATAAAKRQTSTVPIIVIAVGDPVRIGIVESLSHPGGKPPVLPMCLRIFLASSWIWPAT